MMPLIVDHRRCKDRQSINMATNASPSEKTLHLVGVGVGHSIAPTMHNHITKSLGLPWTFHSTECPTLQDVLDLARNPTTAGLVVTMPYKNIIMPHLDALDELSIQIGACNNVYPDPSNPSRLRGTNTDWLGIRGCLLEGSPNGQQVLNKPALIVGAGGASRAAVYALHSHFKSSAIYILNRDNKEVEDLIADTQRLSPPPKIIHIKPSQSQSFSTPYYIVGTVPDLEPKSPEELGVKALLQTFLDREEKGVLLDMCFKPRRTRMIKAAEGSGWACVEGTHVIGYQIEEQYRLWAGEEIVGSLDGAAARSLLMKEAEKSAGINF
jgi:quinate dehydrogenase